MIEAVREDTSRLLQQGYQGVLGLANRWGHVGPHLFTNPDELRDLVLGPRYPLAKLILQMQRRWPGEKLGVIGRGCDQRALKVLEERGVFNGDGFAFVGVACSVEEAEACNCDKPMYDTRGCNGCWKCVEKCPQEAIKIINPCPILVPKEFETGIFPRKAIYKPFPQAVPNVVVRDVEHCLKIQGRLDCKGCENVCEPKAIVHDAEDEEDLALELSDSLRMLAPDADDYADDDDEDGLSIDGMSSDRLDDDQWSDDPIEII